MGSLLAAGGLAWSAVAQVAEEFVLQMAIGRAVGVVSGRAPLVFIRRVPLPSEALYPLRTVFCALALYGGEDRGPRLGLPGRVRRRHPHR